MGSGLATCVLRPDPKNMEEKIYYRIGEVSEKTGIAAHILRYWEKEFRSLSPKREKGKRIYTKKDLELILLLKDLIYKEGYRIKGAKQYLLHQNKRENQREEKKILREIRRDLISLRRLLK